MNVFTKFHEKPSNSGPDQSGGQQTGIGTGIAWQQVLTSSFCRCRISWLQLQHTIWDKNQQTVVSSSPHR